MTEQTTLDRMREGIFIAMPAGKGSYAAPTLIGAVKAAIGLNDRHIPFLVNTPTNLTMICIGRSDIANIFLHNYPEMQWLLFIDDDIGFDFNDIHALFEVNKNIVGAPCPKREIEQKGYNFQLVEKINDQGEKYNIITKDKKGIQVERIGTGFMLIHRSVFMDIAEKFPELEYIPMPERGISSDKACYHYFNSIHDKKHVFTEDMSFCDRSKACGKEIWMSLKTNITHSGMNEFKYPEMITNLLKLGI